MNPADSATEGSAAVFEGEIEVSAQHRPQDLHDVPISIQTVDRDQVFRLGAIEVSNLMYVAPSLAVGGVVGTSSQTMGMRGVVDYSRNTGIESSMGVYVDGVYQGRSYAADQPLLGLDRVELLRGPQGTLFGKNNASGAINLVTRQPTTRTELNVLGEIGSYGHVRAAAYLAGGLSDTVLGSLSVGYSQSDGYYRNTYLDTETGGRKLGAARGKLRFLPSDRVELILSGDVEWWDLHGPKYTSRDLPRLPDTRGVRGLRGHQRVGRLADR